MGAQRGGEGGEICLGGRRVRPQRGYARRRCWCIRPGRSTLPTSLPSTVKRIRLPDVRLAALLAVIPLLAACARSSVAGTSAASPLGAATVPVAHGLRIAERYRVEAITTRRFTHEVFWRAIAPSLSSEALRSEEIGRSLQGRAIQS